MISDLFLLGACILLNYNVLENWNKWHLPLLVLAVHCCFLASFPETIAHLHRVQLFLSFSPLKLLLIFTPSLQMLETCLVGLGDQLLYHVI